MNTTIPNLDAFSPEAQKHIAQVFHKNYDSTYKRDTLLFLQKHPEEVNSAFSTLSFGTGGIRALMGVGSARLNEYTIEMITQGLALYLKKQKKKRLSVFISYDNRHHSYFFAKLSAQVLAGNGIDVYLVKNLRPTPLCSFGCRYYGCNAGIMITASHNAPEYNGYKVYWSDGAQVTEPHDQGIMQAISTIEGPEEVLRANIKNPRIHWVDHTLDQAYFQEAKTLFSKMFGRKARKSRLRIVYSNLHGTGITIIPTVLEQLGFSELFYVKEQLPPDPQFSAAENPNPEELHALQLGVDLMVKKADLFLATDPDADRIGVIAMHDKTPIRFSGNQVACLCLDFLLHNKESFPKNPAFIKSLVTTDLFSTMCKAHGYPCYEVPTGFKYIAEKIAAWDTSKEHSFVFGAEESLGYLLGSFVRDKDAAIAAGLIALVTEDAKKQNLSLYALLKKIYASYGVYREKLLSFSFSIDQEPLMKGAMEELRKHPKRLSKKQTLWKIEDYEKGIVVDLIHKTEQPLGKKNAGMLRYTFQEFCSVTLRISGTEPKIKSYLSSHRKEFASVDEAIKDCDHDLDSLEEEVRSFFRID